MHAKQRFDAAGSRSQPKKVKMPGSLRRILGTMLERFGINELFDASLVRMQLDQYMINSVVSLQSLRCGTPTISVQSKT